MSEGLSDFDGLLNWERLTGWLESQDLPGSGPVAKVEQLQGGSQNNLFLMTRGDAQFVMRRPPRHLRANSNKTMLREARVLKAIADSKVPHPKFLAVCEDEEVIGANFYLMNLIDGFSPSGELPGEYATNKDWQFSMGEELMRASAALAGVDHEAVGLGDYSRSTDNWHSKQVDRWRSQLEGYSEFEGYQGSELPHVEEVGRWLNDNIPSDGRVGIIHGDFQFPNVMFAYDKPKIAAVIDWELSALGDPMLDLGWVLTSWCEEGDENLGAGKAPMVQPWNNFMTRQDLINLYCELTGRNTSDAFWFFVMACYKLACILEGTYARSKAGQAPEDIGERLHAYADWLFSKGKQLIDKA